MQFGCSHESLTGWIGDRHTAT